MEIESILALTKARLGIRSEIRDAYLIAIIRSILDELVVQQKAKLDAADLCHQMLVVDLAAWRYECRKENGDMPVHLQNRLQNMMKVGGGGEL